jgi:ABC-2 type transport system ATP-binding protein
MAEEVPSAIDVRDLSLAFGPVQALDRVTFHVPVGSITGLIGRNGAGKSTTIRVLAGLIRTDVEGGLVRIFGHSPGEERRAILSRTGFLLSDPALFGYLTPLETLRFLGRAYGLSAAQSAARAEELVEFFDLVDARDRLADNFSTGMKKRLSLAAALIHAPSLLVLDEPFESLDPLMVRTLKKLLMQLRDAGGTILLSSHLIDAVDEICDRVVILEQGRVAAAGATGEAKASIADRLPGATLEDLYASLVHGGPPPGLKWLTGEGGEEGT